MGNLSHAARSNLPRSQLNGIPIFPYAPDTTRFCAWWLDNDGLWTCDDVQTMFGLSMTDFQRWNPSLPLPCDVLPVNQSFCIAAAEGRPALQTVTVHVTVPVTIPVTVPASAAVTVPVSIPVPVPVTVSVTVDVTSTSVSTTTITTTVTSAPTPTVGVNGVETPAPYQPGMVDNCQRFYLVQPGDTCVIIGARFNVAPEQLVVWNPYARLDCTRMLANTFCCVGI
ncbi:hypothetical protein B0T25DRAFT_500051 [Lasiosphaeria hispida]|uniref:LysM domain-containing protein n=1 Tax=Lasiosphaeria hispida TaxID=260671 RepID=A0AAJ0HGH4_9PEZI|nr:hypothetical protein B0T25DRAFT_500051 [Lasiosphaeria hispida]